MRTTINLPDRLFKTLKEIEPHKTKTQILIEAIEEYINKIRRDRLLSLKGKIKINYDWKTEEEIELMKVNEGKPRYGKKGSR